MVGKNMVNVYVADITDLPDPLENPERMEGLSEERKSKIMRCKRSESRRQRLGAGMLLREVLNRHGAQEQDIQIGKNGKPEVEGVHFNLSHSYNLVVCVVGNDVVGCDVEREETTDKSDIADRFFSENEILYLNENKEEFVRLWTLKESYVKMTGEGFGASLNQFEVCLEDEVKVYRNGIPSDCTVKEYEIPGYRLAICAKEDEFSEEVEYIFLGKNGDS